MEEPIKRVDYDMGPDPSYPRVHPDTYFEEIGLTYESAEPNSVLDHWKLFGVRGLPSPLPKWFRVVDA